MHISGNGLHLIEQFEGFIGHPYWDPYGRVWTRGFGETEGISAHSPTISREQAQLNLQRLVEERYEPVLRGLPLSQNQWDALCSFIWNLGPGVVGQGTTLRGLLERREYTAAGSLMEQYVHAGGVVLQGLVTRRRAEVALFLAAPQDPLAGLQPRERQLVEEYDHYRQHPLVHSHALARVRAELVQLRKAIWLAAERGERPDGTPTEKGWGVRSRAHRYHVLLSRTR